MLPIVAEQPLDAAVRTRVVVTTQSPQFLDAFGDTRRTTTVLECREGKTRRLTLSGERLDSRRIRSNTVPIADRG